MVSELLLQTLKGGAGDVREGLLRGHQGQVMVGLEAKQVHHLAHHFAVLARQDHPGSKIVRVLKRPDHGSELDGFWACAQNNGDQRLVTGSRRQGLVADVAILEMAVLDTCAGRSANPAQQWHHGPHY